MSNLYPDKKTKEKVVCMACAEFDVPDMWCPIFQKDIADLYEPRVCSRFVRIKEAEG